VIGEEPQRVDNSYRESEILILQGIGFLIPPPLKIFLENLTYFHIREFEK